MAILIKVDGTETKVSPKRAAWTLEEFQKIVGGYFTIMPGVRPLRMIMDEEGDLRGKEINQKATDMVRLALKDKPLRYNPVIRGDVLVLEKGERM